MNNYAILLKRNADNTLYMQYIKVPNKVTLQWYYDTLECHCIDHAIRRIYNKYDFVFDDEYLLRHDTTKEYPVAICRDYEEAIFGNLLILPYIVGADDFQFFDDERRAMQALKQVKDFISCMTYDKDNFNIVLTYSAMY